MQNIPLQSIEKYTFLIITILGVAYGQVTVFYLLYFFWFQVLLKNIVDFILYKLQKPQAPQIPLALLGSNILMMVIYLIFIVIIFGLMMNWYQKELLFLNVKTMMFLNKFFVLNLLLFLVQYIFYKKDTKVDVSSFEVFNKSHVILHISIILGAVIDGVISDKIASFFPAESLWPSAFVVIPFVLLKFFIGGIENDSRSQ